MLYPEGTIYPGPDLGELKMGMFRDAAKYDYTIHPVAVEYQDPKDVWESGIGFVGHFFRQFGGSNVNVRVSFGPPLAGEDEMALADQFKAWLEPEIQSLREGWYRED